MAFALANGRTAGAFVNLTTQDGAFEAIKSFGLSLVCQREELEACVDFVLGKPSEKIPDGKETAKRLAQVDWGRFVQFLETQSGIPADTWLWGKSAQYTMQA